MMDPWLFPFAWAATTLLLIVEIIAGLDLRRQNRDLRRKLGIKPEDEPDVER